ncbi:fumarylacetoacetate hydrolase family protein [Sphingobium sp.]|uniref:fumarylacetoacetate hydrolase family protein n=1 Tax=Sphingobium sp. TaxID=1912891 RepID=UPI0028BE97A9|nr:fumarylacetoacetate hydrolase family protein [Sphingobium sp.]
MKIVGFEREGQTFVGSLEADGMVRAIAELGAFWRDPVSNPAAAGEVVGKLTDLPERPAVPLTGRVICVGLNYRRHAEEGNMPIPTVPMIFARWSSTLAVDGQPAPCVEEKFDWEGELGAVVGRRMFRVDEAQAAAGVFGYFAFNDLSARSFQMHTSQWIMGKNSDASGPMTAIVTADKIDPIAGLRLTTKVNGAIKQDSTTADMIFTVPQLLAYVSQVMTLEPGDVIVTGTPSGVGMVTGEFLKPGDEVEVEIEGIGRVRTPITEAPTPIF